MLVVVTECPLCRGKGQVVWKMKDCVSEPSAMTEADENDMDVPKCECPNCNGSGVEPANEE